jgi:uncharacterized repeat protein (TIGR01451 family)
MFGTRTVSLVEATEQGFVRVTAVIKFTDGSAPQSASCTVIGTSARVSRLSVSSNSRNVENFSHTGESIPFEVSVQNAGNVVHHDLAVSTNPAVLLVCDNTTLAVTDTPVVCRGTAVTTQNDVDNGFLQIQAAATSREQTQPQRAIVLRLPFVGARASATVKLETNSKNTVRVGDKVPLRITVVNTGPLSLHTVTVVLKSLTPTSLTTLVCVPTAPAQLGPGASMVCNTIWTVPEKQQLQSFQAQVACKELPSFLSNIVSFTILTSTVPSPAPAPVSGR